jgi:hypothetical protein
MPTDYVAEAASCTATQELPGILWDPRVYYRVHNSLPLVPILSQITPIYTTPPVSPTSILILSINLLLGLPSGLFPPNFSHQKPIFITLIPICVHALFLSSSLT